MRIIRANRIAEVKTEESTRLEAAREAGARTETPTLWKGAEVPSRASSGNSHSLVAEDVRSTLAEPPIASAVGWSGRPNAAKPGGTAEVRETFVLCDKKNIAGRRFIV